MTRPDEPPLVLHLLGSPRVSGAGSERAAELLSRPKTLALLAYLAVAGRRRVRQRDDILGLFWPDSDEARARNSLRQALFLLKQHLPPDAIVLGASDQVAVGAGVVVDARAFEDDLDAGRDREALTHYAGTLLDGCRLYAGSDIDAWLAVERERLAQRAVRAAVSVARRSGTDGDVAGLGQWLRFALAQSPFDEALLRTAVGLFHEHGDPGGAASAHADAVERFRSTLGIELSPESVPPRPTTDAARTISALPATTLVAANGATNAKPVRQSRVVAPEARRRYLEARHHAGQRSPVTILKAIDCYERALALSPDYAEAHAGLGFALCQAAVYVPYPSSDAWPRVKAHGLRAIALDPTLGDGYAVVAQASLCYDYDWDSADRYFRRALQVDPTSSLARQLYPLYFLTAAGRMEEALAVLDQARDDAPESAAFSVYYGMCCVFGRDFERALQEVDTLLAGQPSLVQAHWIRGMALEGMGEYAAAIRSFETGMTLTGRSSLFLTQLGRACASSGDHGRASSILREFDARDEDSGPAHYGAAEILAAMGAIEPALDRLYRAYRERNPFVVFAGVKFGLDPLRGTERFRQLLARVRVPSGRPARS